MRFKTRAILGAFLCVAAVSAPAHADNYYARTQLKKAQSHAPAQVIGQWQAGAWTGWSSTCSEAAIRTRSVSCSANGQLVSDSACDKAGVRPISSEVQEDYSGCPADWMIGAWTSWSSTCSDAATRIRSVTCVSHGGLVEDYRCESSSPKPQAFQTESIYSGCIPAWKEGEWGEWSTTCSLTAPSVRSRSVTCSQGPNTVDNSLCTETKPQTTESRTFYGGCSAQLLNSHFKNDLTYWTVEGTVTSVNYSTADNAARITKLSTISQKTEMPLLSGQKYAISGTLYEGGGTFYWPNVTITVTSQSGVVLLSYLHNRYSTFTQKFVGTGEPVTIKFKNNGSNAAFVNLIAPTLSPTT